MIRLVGKKLIIPRGDTGSFSVPLVTTFDPSDKAIFSILDEKTQTVVIRIECNITQEALTVNFIHEKTVNLPIGKYYWDIKSYKNPKIVDGELIGGTEVDSYYAAYSLPICEIRQTGDKLLTADENDEPSILNQQDFNLLNATLNEVRDANTALQQYKGEIEDMLHQEQRLETVETSLQELATNLQSLEDELQQHTIEANETLNQRLEILGNTLQELEANLQLLSNTLQQHISEVNDMFNQEERIQTIQSNITSIQNSLTSINNTLNALNTTLQLSTIELSERVIPILNKKMLQLTNCDGMMFEDQDQPGSYFNISTENFETLKNIAVHYKTITPFTANEMSLLRNLIGSQGEESAPPENEDPTETPGEDPNNNPDPDPNQEPAAEQPAEETP